eukprot:3034983-Prymnesium_polylepis.1
MGRTPYATQQCHLQLATKHRQPPLRRTERHRRRTPQRAAARPLPHPPQRAEAPRRGSEAQPHRAASAAGSPNHIDRPRRCSSAHQAERRLLTPCAALGQRPWSTAVEPCHTRHASVSRSQCAASAEVPVMVMVRCWPQRFESWRTTGDRRRR